MGTSANNAASPGEEMETELKRKRREIFQLSNQLQKYRREDAGAIDMEEDI